MTLLGMVASGLLATVKLVAGLVGHSYALVADAVESFADIASSAVVFGGLAVSVRPPDDNHPYGHGKAESLAALAVGLMLVAAAVGISVQAAHEIITPHRAPAPFTLVVLAVVVVVKETLFRISARVARRIGSTAVQADALHHRSDALTSLVAAIGISISVYAGAGYESADGWAAIAASFLIAYNGIRFIRMSAAELMDIQPAAEILASMSNAARAVEGVEAVEKVLARKTGTSYLADMHIEVDPALTVREGHDLAHRVKEAVRVDNPRVADVLVHVEPHETTLTDGEPREDRA